MGSDCVCWAEVASGWSGSGSAVDGDYGRTDMGGIAGEACTAGRLWHCAEVSEWAGKGVRVRACVRVGTDPSFRAARVLITQNLGHLLVHADHRSLRPPPPRPAASHGPTRPARRRTPSLTPVEATTRRPLPHSASTRRGRDTPAALRHYTPKLPDEAPRAALILLECKSRHR